MRIDDLILWLGSSLSSQHAAAAAAAGSSGRSEGVADKRAHHNALERKRRDHIKDNFSVLRDSVPTLSGEKVGVRLIASVLGVA